jgi:hypothetical protein
MDVKLIIILIFAVVVLTAITVAARLISKGGRVNQAYFSRRWQDILKLCSDESSWMQAIIQADVLLDEALRKKHYKGTSTGQRLTSASRAISDPDAVWSAHKLRNRLTHESGVRLTKNIVIRTLEGFRSALRDLEAMR